VAIVLDVPLEVALERNARRQPPRPPAGALRRQHRWLREALHELPHEGLAAIHHIRSEAEVDAVRVADEAGDARRLPS
jgi:hypothetical protein